MLSSTSGARFYVDAFIFMVFVFICLHLCFFFFIHSFILSLSYTHTHSFCFFIATFPFSSIFLFALQLLFCRIRIYFKKWYWYRVCFYIISTNIQFSFYCWEICSGIFFSYIFSYKQLLVLCFVLHHGDMFGVFFICSTK